MTLPSTVATPPEQAAQVQRRSTVLLLAVLVLLVSLATDLRVLPADGALGQDFDDFYVAAKAQAAGQNPYDGQVLTRFEQQLFGQASFSNTVASPPAFFVAFRPFLAITPRQGYRLAAPLRRGAGLRPAGARPVLGIGPQRAAVWALPPARPRSSPPSWARSAWCWSPATCGRSCSCMPGVRSPRGCCWG